MSEQNKIIVLFRDFDNNKDCFADIVLPISGRTVEGFTVKNLSDGGIGIYMPSETKSVWNIDEVTWEDVRQQIKEEYLKVRNSVPSHTRIGVCTFYNLFNKTDVYVDILHIPSNRQFNDFLFIHKKSDGSQNDFLLLMPKETQERWNNDYIHFSYLSQVVTKEYKRQILGEEQEQTDDSFEIKFKNIQQLKTCVVDVKLPHKSNEIKGFRIKEFGANGRIIISLPRWINRWNDRNVSFHNLCSIISEEYRKYERIKNKETKENPEDCQTEDSVTLLNNADNKEIVMSQSNTHSPKKEKNEFGRIKNAENSSLIFYPRTVLRAFSQSEDENVESKKNLSELIKAMSKEVIGPFEINILKWISKLRYVTSIMILDLIKAGYISFGRRSSITQNKLAKIINRMAEYELISLTRFMKVNDDGSLSGDAHSAMRILTLGRHGSVLLRELKNVCRFNVFDIFQDGNTVKRYLISNQWLIYWLTTYKEEIGENYTATCVINMRGTEYIGARIYATVTLNGHTMIAEPVRRMEEFEIKSYKKFLREKIQRICLIFDNMDKLYYGNTDRLYHKTEGINFPERPVIVLVCEDDEHIRQTWEDIRDILPDDNRQIIWFSSDLRIFNYDKKGERFLYFEDDTMKIVDIKQVLGVDDES